MTTWRGPTPLHEVVDELEAMADDEVILLATPHGLSALERAHAIDNVQAIAAELRRRGHEPCVEMRTTPAGEAYAISINRRAS